MRVPVSFEDDGDEEEDDASEKSGCLYIEMAVRMVGCASCWNSMPR
jgi:hypothetical protein